MPSSIGVESTKPATDSIDLTMDVSDVDLEKRNGKWRCESDVAGPSKKAQIQEGNMTNDLTTPESAPVHPFFKNQLPASTSARISLSSTASKPALLSTLTSQLPLPETAPSSNLTRSQRLFSFATKINPLSLSIIRGDEFFLFMDMRAEQQWTSYNMTSHRWVNATNTYNNRLEALAQSRNQVFIPKNPRALMEKLGEIEPKISERLIHDDFRSATGTETFWRKHCHAVPLVKLSPSEAAVSQGGKKPCKPATCARCLTIMYPRGCGNSHLNHKLGHCSDGVKQKSTQELPPWPQPQGIFTGGTHFHPIPFLTTLRDVYEKIVTRGETGDSISMEYEAFANMLAKRTSIRENGVVLFKLFDLLMPPSFPNDLIVDENGAHCLRLDCLGNDN